MLIKVDYNSGEPISRQVVDQIKWLVVSGHLAPGEKLPSIRALAKQLKVNPTTVTRIYNELSAERVITLRQGQGAFVSSKSSVINKTEAKKQIRELAKRMLVESSRLGLSRKDVEGIIQKEFKKISGDSQ